MAVKVSSTSLHYQHVIEASEFQFLADEPTDIGGDNTGPKPTDYVLAGLGACKAITIKMYAERKGWDVQDISVELELQTVERQVQIVAKLKIQGELSLEQRERLRAIADKCPVHKLIAGETRVRTKLLLDDAPND